ncbi:hypothetical protein GGI24_001286 [Coemansia furcata]|nr:hypothetical protein GGI24_001286 [Coemansia furcata]
MSVVTLSRHTFPSAASKAHCQSRRGLAAGLIYINSKPAHATRKVLIDAAQNHGLVYDVWLSGPQRRRNSVTHRAAIRITTEPVPETIEAISLLPDPTKEEVDAIRAASFATVATLKKEGVHALPILKEPAFFQNNARRALGFGPDTRLFDKRTTSRPRHATGMMDGYRAGFLEARRKRDANNIVEQSLQSENALEFLAGYFEHKLISKL